MNLLASLIILTNSLLWQIDGNSYLFGTVHSICIDSISLSPVHIQALKQCEALCLEAHIDTSGSAWTSNIINLLDTSGKTLADYYSPDTLAAIGDRMKPLGIDIQELQYFKPCVLLFLTVPVPPCKAIAIEDTLIKIARASGIPILGLETIGEQIAAFEHLTPQQIAAEVLADNGSGDSSNNVLMELYKLEDITSLWALSAKAIGADMIVTDRNRAWLPRIEQMNRDGRHFIAVGAGHLFGLILELRARGHTVQPIK